MTRFTLSTMRSTISAACVASRGTTVLDASTRTPLLVCCRTGPVRGPVYAVTQGLPLRFRERAGMALAPPETTLCDARCAPRARAGADPLLPAAADSESARCTKGAGHLHRRRDPTVVRPRGSVRDQLVG